MSSPDDAALRSPGLATSAGGDDDHPDLAAAGKLFPLDSHNVSLLDKVTLAYTQWLCLRRVPLGHGR